MRLLVLTFYYPPDLSAGSFRAGALVKALRERAASDVQIDVVTTLPNRYRTFCQEAAELEVADGLEVRRIALPPHRSDVRQQSRAFVHYARRALAAVATREYDLVFATSSRLMTAALGARIARQQHARLYLDIRDIFVDTIKDLLPRWAAWPAQRMFSVLESMTMRHADRINLVSAGFAEYFRERGYGRSLASFTNGIDEEFLAVQPTPGGAPSRAGELPVILYAGNIGEGQALHRIVPDLALALHGRTRFVVVGDGGRRDTLEQALVSRGVSNVELRPPMSREHLLRAYLAADVLFLHLGPQPAFHKVLPSKIFEYAAIGKPILAGVAGYAARFLRDEVANAAVFAPREVAGAIRGFESLELVDRPRQAFIEKFSRARIAGAMADDVLALLPSSTHSTDKDDD